MCCPHLITLIRWVWLIPAQGKIICTTLAELHSWCAPDDNDSADITFSSFNTKLILIPETTVLQLELFGKHRFRLAPHMCHYLFSICCQSISAAFVSIFFSFWGWQSGSKFHPHVCWIIRSVLSLIGVTSNNGLIQTVIIVTQVEALFFGYQFYCLYYQKTIN